jgi:hypothetical protein
MVAANVRGLMCHRCCTKHALSGRTSGSTLDRFGEYIATMYNCKCFQLASSNNLCIRIMDLDGVLNSF